jgi:release factor glutamine methyltransferase
MPPVSLFLFQGKGRLSFGPHPDRASADAELLLMHLLRTNRAWLIANSNVEIGFENWKPYFKLLQRRYLGEPIQYIIGEQEFYGLPFRVTPDVLIPRPETEHLVEKALELATILKSLVTGHDFSRAESRTKENRALAPEGHSSSPLRILDVGTGSGAIAVALAHNLPDARVTALDISAEALEIASENAARNAVSARIRFIHSDLLAAIAHERFDMVVSNPPYVPARDRDSLSVEVREHEPALALFAGEDGLDIYRRLIPDAFAVLEPRGYLLMEIGYGQSETVAALMQQAGFQQIEFIPDLQGIPRVACGQRSA